MTAMALQDLDTVVGCSDGFKHGYIEGWAWRPNRPHDTVIVQLLVDGLLVDEVAACQPRPDLATAGIGHGHHAFAIPLLIEPDSPPILHLTIRAKDGPILPFGEIEFVTSEDARVQLAQRNSVENLETIFGPFTRDDPPPRRRMTPEPAPRLNFVLYAAVGRTVSSAVLGVPEYSYVIVMQGFRDLLRKIGVVHMVQDPGEADDIYRQCLDRGESCLMFSFTPPQNAPLGLRCQMIPVIAWEFGSIPTGGWAGDVREDWRYVLRQTGRAITISGFAAKAIRATMGADYPVAFIPTPVWDRQVPLRARSAGANSIRPGGPVTLEFDGFAWDSRVATLLLEERTPSPPLMPRRPQPAVLPMRGALLALAEASGAEQRKNATAASRALARLEAERQSAHLAALSAAESEAQTQRILRQAAGEAAARHSEAMQGAAEQALQEISERPKTMGRKFRITAFLARQWYREVVRDALPSPVARGLSSAGRALLGGRPVWPATAEDVPEIERAPKPLDVNLDADDIAAAGIGRGLLPREAEDAESETALAPTDVAVAAREDTAGVSALPPTALYLPVGDANNPEPVTAPPRYMPAPTLPPLPEFELANFSPDPHPLLRPAPAGGASVRVDGLIFTAVLAPKDGRKNWQDILTAFTTAFRDTPDATLVLKMIGADPAFWWWELNGIAKTLPPFACRVVVINGFLQDAAYADLIAATHFVVNASLAEGQCLPLAEFMSAGRPAIAPRHTAMRDYITSGNALIVGSEAEFCSFPQDPRNMLTTTRYRIEWPSLCAAFTQAAGIIRNDPDRYVAMGQAAMVSLRAYCSDETVSRALASFLGLGDEVLERAGWQGLPRDAAEPVLGGSGLMDPGAVAFAAAGALP